MLKNIVFWALFQIIVFFINIFCGFDVKHFMFDLVYGLLVSCDKCCLTGYDLNLNDE